MAAVTKPIVTTNIFADAAVAPPDTEAPTYMTTGFPLVAGVPVIPPRGFINWLFNYCMKGIRYAMQRGVTDWDAAEDGYAAGAVVQSTDGNLYRLVGTATTALSPQADQGNWAPFLATRALNDAMGGLATSFDGSSNPTTWNDMLTADGAPISGLDVLPTFAAASGFAVTVGAGSGFLSTSVGLHAGESPYRTIYWAGQNVTLANPDGSHARIDAITVTPAVFGSPSALAVISGTPATTPLPPAIPSGSAALFYVLVPAAGSDATVFRACRGLGRRVDYPWSGMSGIISGAELSWDYRQDPASGGATMYVGAADKTGTNMTVNRLLIDGEVIEWAGYLTDIAGIVSDSTADPFSGIASASFDKPYYVYACGGRHNPIPCSGPFAAFLNPVTVCESTVPPNPKTGKPTGNLTVNGVTVTPNGAVYIGLGFIVNGTNHRRGCMMDGEMTCSLNPLGFLGFNVVASGKNDMGTFTGQCQPSISTKMLLSASFTNAGTASECGIFLDNFPTSVGGSGIRGWCPASGEQTFNYVPVSFTPRSSAEIWAQLNTGNGSIQVYAMGFNHRVNRIGLGY